MSKNVSLSVENNLKQFIELFIHCLTNSDYSGSAINPDAGLSLLAGLLRPLRFFLSFKTNAFSLLVSLQQ